MCVSMHSDGGNGLCTVPIPSLIQLPVLKSSAAETADNVLNPAQLLLSDIDNQNSF